MSLRYLAAAIYVTVFEHRALSVKITKHQCTLQVNNIKLTCMQMLYTFFTIQLNVHIILIGKVMQSHSVCFKVS